MIITRRFFAKVGVVVEVYLIATKKQNYIKCQGVPNEP